MNVGEIWKFNGSSGYTIYNRSIEEGQNNIYNLKGKNLKTNDCFIILENFIDKHQKNYIVCIFFEDAKWYLEVSKSYVVHGLFKKL